jgi:hypothetical protein
MGEYANYLGKRIKIGTCEDMLYLRWDQRHLVTESETPLFDEKVLSVLRFRFPWPDEDAITPGNYDDPFRGLRLDHGYENPKDMEHGLVQFVHQANGYLVSLPCPEANELTLNGKTITIHKNGYGGPASLIGQGWRGGRLVGIARCNGCHYAYRLEDGQEEAAAVAIRSEADRTAYDPAAGKHMPYRSEAYAKSLHDIADRLLAGYSVKVTA